jgi:hypothetical protein
MLLTLLWPPLMIFLSHLCPIELMILLCCWKLVLTALSWYRHFQLAAVISDWHRSALRAKMKKAGIKPRWAPTPPPLRLLPSNLMALSCVMLLMSRVGLRPLPPLTPPVTWVEALGHVRSLDVNWFFTVRPPPEPPPFNPFPDDGSLNDSVSLASACDSSVSNESAASAGDGEGDCNPDGSCCCVNHLQSLSNNYADDFLMCQFITGLAAEGLHNYDTTSYAPHLATGWLSCTLLSGLRCCLSQWPLAFGPIGLLADTGAANTVIVDTGASMCVSPFRSVFECYE